MELNFEIQGQELIRTDEIKIVNKLRNYLKCKFLFKTDEWENIDKYVIFKDNYGKAYQLKLEKDKEYCVTVPHEVLGGNLFKVTVYGGDLLTTSEKVVLLSESGYTSNVCASVPSSEDVFTHGFRLINSKVSDITFEDNILNIYANDKLIKSIEILNDEFIEDIIEKCGIDDILDSLENKSDKNHTHMSEDITDFEDRTRIEIKQAYLYLANKIRTYGE